MLHRRAFMTSAAAATAALGAAGFPRLALAQQGLEYGPAEPFAFDTLVARAKDAAAKPYRAPVALDGDILNRIDYDAHGKIRYKPGEALFADGPGDHPVTFFHLGRFFQKPVHMHVVANGQAREIRYEPSLFDMPADSPARELTGNIGFAGFRIQESRKGQPGPKGAPLDWRSNDWVAFLGASYFRAIGELYQYGLSARGIAIDVAAADRPEEFPDFTQVYFETPKPGDEAVTVYALLDGPSVCGAYRFVMRRGAGVIIDVDTNVFLRRDVQRLGIAPLTSMYWYSETRKPTAVDWRPEVHDSDGLAMQTGTGEQIWRPLNNPVRTTASAFADDNPRGFGLMQRDRVVDHYLDGVAYERRPSLWVEPVGPWGKGAVQLVEIPTDDEIHDNVVAMWVPAEPAKAGGSYAFRYKTYWAAGQPYASSLAPCVATRLGNGGQPGTVRPHGVRKFMVEFLGAALEDVPFGVRPEAVLWASRGNFSYVFTEAVPDDVPGHWRAQFDLTASGPEPVEMRCYLKLGDKVLTETWLYQYQPF